MAPDGLGGGARSLASLPTRAAFEAGGTAFLLTAVVGSGVMGERLAGGSVAVALLANSLATGAALVALIVTVGPISGAHLNPLISMTAVARGDLPAREAAAYVGAQLAGAIAGVAITHAMFELPAFAASSHVRAGPALVVSEAVATFGLVVVVAVTAATRAALAPLAIAAYVTAGYWFSSSTCFANPAVTLARAATDTFTGIRPVDVPWFLVGQIVGASAATLAIATMRRAVARRDGDS